MAEQPRIVVTDGGPYVVTGKVPLREMAPVHTMNGEPVAWHVLGDYGEPAESYELCRCGRSGDKPFCDGSHERGPWPSKETAKPQPVSESAQHVEGTGASLLDEPSLCAEAGFCGTRTTDVWKLIADGSAAARERARAMVWMCPSGRLVYVDNDSGTAVEPDYPMEIAVVPGGPLWVRGGAPVESADGTPWPEQARRTLCRCGASANKPFCDGAHTKIGFDER